MKQLKIRQCTRCKKTPDEVPFPKDSSKKDGLWYMCKPCYKIHYHAVVRGYELKAAYGITLEEYNQYIKNQNNKCAVCDEDMYKRYNVDHCHKTGKFRAILCYKCNPGLGYFEDNIGKLLLAIKYLKKHQETL